MVRRLDTIVGGSQSYGFQDSEIIDVVAEVITSPYRNSSDIAVGPPFGLRCPGSQSRKELSLVSSHESFLPGEINLAHDML